MKRALIFLCLACWMLPPATLATTDAPPSAPVVTSAPAEQPAIAKPPEAAPPEVTPAVTGTPSPTKAPATKAVKKPKPAKKTAVKPPAGAADPLAQIGATPVTAPPPAPAASPPAVTPAPASAPPEQVKSIPTTEAAPTTAPGEPVSSSSAESPKATLEAPTAKPSADTAAVKPVEAPPQPALPAKPAQQTFLIEPLGNEVYAAIAKIGGRASSNTMFVIGTHYVVAIGAHMTKEVIQDLNAEIASRTSKPVRYFVLAHHHPGYSHVDFDFPPDQDVIMAWQAWQQLNDDVRKPDFPIIFFNEGMTIKPGGVTIVLSNLGRGHSAGDVVTFIPETGVIFASDLFYVDSVGYMAGGFMREWILALEALEQLGADRIIPGTGPVSSIDEVTKFKEFFRDFLTEVIRHIERGDTLEQTLQTFDLPKYRNLSGYQLLMKANLKRAYEELKLEFGR